MGTTRSRRGWLGFCVCLALFAVGCSDDEELVIDSHAAVVTGSQVKPNAVTTAARGNATVTVTAEDSRQAGTPHVDVLLDTTGLVDVTLAHIHFGDPDEPGPPILPVYDATLDGAFDATLDVQITPDELIPRPDVGIDTFAEAVAAIRGGHTYLQVHTLANPGGEIRGHIGRAVLFAELEGAQETPPVTTTATGNATITLNEAQNQVTVELAVDNITSPTAAHIHVAAVGVPGPVIFALGVAAQTGTVDINLTQTLSGVDLTAQAGASINAFADAIAAILAGGTYVNVHTVAEAGGEIRGQIE